jgi:hypothetical protein
MKTLFIGRVIIVLVRQGDDELMWEVKDEKLL